MADARNDPIREEAIDWLLKVQTTPNDPAVLTGLESWRAKSDDHEAAYRSISRMWRVAGQLPQGYPNTASQDRTERPAHRYPSARSHRRQPVRRPIRRIIAAATAVGIAACLAFFVAPAVGIQLQADFTAGTGEVRNISLQDGSALYLDAESAVAVDFANENRAVTLLSGQAYFDVVRDTNRPFTVAADDLTVTVRGTGFSVRSAPDSITVAVAEGKVEVSPPGQHPSQHKESLFLLPGDKIRFDRNNGTVTKSRIDPGDVASWRNGQLVSSGMSFRDLADYIGRYRRGEVLITSDRLADRRITGVFDLTDPTAALRVAAETQQAQVTEITPFLLMVRPR